MDSDPTPGDPERVRQLSVRLQNFADDAEEALSKVQALVNDGGLASFVGLTAEAFRDRFDKVPPNLTKLHTSYDLAASALARYWPRLESAQSEADSALTEAVDAKAELDAARARLASALTTLEGAEEAADPPDEDEVSQEVKRALADAKTAHAGEQTAVANAENRLEIAIGLARQAKQAREEAAEDCAGDLDEASDAGMQNKKWWQKAVDWVVDNWDTIVAIARVVVAVLGIIVMIIGGPLAWIVLAAALIVLADTLIKYANGEASLWDVAFAALDCIPGFKGLTTVAGLAGGVKKYVTNFKNMKSMYQSQGIRGIGKVLIGDPIDIATGEMTLRNHDVELPGILPLVLEREHLSNYRNGRWFGRSWASTLDQRLTLNQWGVDYYADDGMILHYPIPHADYDGPVYPVAGPRWPLAWDGRPGAPMSLTQTDTGRTLHFAPVPGRKPAELPLLAITDRNTNRIDIHYNDDGAPTEITHSGGYRIGIGTYDNRITSYTLLSDPDQPVLRAFDYDDNGNLAAVFNSSGLPLTFEYDDKRRMTRWEDRNNTWYSYEYDHAGRCVFTTGTDRALEYRYHYDRDNLRTTATNSLGHTTTYQMNDAWQVVAETDPLGHTTTKTWDEYNRPLSITDPLGRTTRYEYDNNGNLTTLTRPDGAVVRAQYNELGLLTELVEADGTCWQQAYDPAGNRTALVDPAGNRTRYGHDPTGAINRVTGSSGATTTVDVNSAGLPITVTAPDGGTTSVERDTFGRPQVISDPLNARTYLQWNIEGKLLSECDPLGSTESFVYDAEGNMLSRTDSCGGKTTYTYGAFDLPASRINPDGTTYTFTRDTELRLITVTTPLNQKWTYTYDPAGRITEETDYDGRTTTYKHDPAGQLRERTNPIGQTIGYTYNLLGQLTGKATPHGTTGYVRDLAGRVQSAHSPGATLSRRYDALGNLLSETVNGRTLSLAYDAAGRPAQRITPSGHTSSWSYTSTGKTGSLVAAGRELGFTHDLAGRETFRRIGNSITLATRWDKAGRLISQVTADSHGDPIFERSYKYRSDHYLTELSESGSGMQSFALDDLGRVTRYSAPDWSEEYSYDSLGNQATAQWPAVGEEAATGKRHYTGSLLTRAGAMRYEYDEVGRTTLRQKTRLSRTPDTWHYFWNSEDQLVRTVTPSGAIWSYTYDPLGRRISKQRITEDGKILEQLHFTWHDTILVEQQSDNGNATCWDYHGRTPLSQTEYSPAREDPECEFYAIISDLVGSPTQLIDEAGEIAWTRKQTLWGAETSPGANRTPLRFPGQYRDEETGWFYNFHRHYDPELGRYTSVDPLGLVPSPNAYTYPHNPCTWTDPLGLSGHFTHADLDRVADHLRNRPGIDPFEPNEQMISRIRKNLDDGTPLSDGQNNFMKHELREADLMDRGMPYEQAHAEALKEHPPGRNYDPDIIRDSPWFGPWWRRMNDL